MKEEYYDHYGFKTNSLTIKIQSYLKDPEGERESQIKWQGMLYKIPELRDQNNRDLISEVRKGIPDQLRSKIWQQLIVPPLKSYENYVNKLQLKEVDLDIQRTIPTNKNQKKILGKLRSVLNALAKAFPEIGYCQGANFIVANILLLLNEQQTFNVMFHILYWQRHEQLMSNLSKIHCKVFILQKLIKKHYPKLFKTLQKYEVQTLVYASSWFITLFNNVLPCSFALRIIELYLVQGQKILYRVALQILKQKKKVIKKLTQMGQIIEQLKGTAQFNQITIKKFFTEMFEINLSRKELQSFENEFFSKHSQKIQ